MTRMSIRHHWCNFMETSLCRKFWIHRIPLQGHCMRNLWVQSEYISLKATKYNRRLSPIFALDVKPFCTNWYRWPGDLIDPWSHLVFQMDIIWRKPVLVERLVCRRFVAFYGINGIILDDMKLNPLKSSGNKRSCVLKQACRF